MYQIRPWLFVGNYRDSRDGELLAARGISAVLQLASPVPSPGCETLLLQIEDGEPVETALFERGVSFVVAAGNSGKRVLIACGAGISRSVIFATAALRLAEGLALIDAAGEVKRHHPDAVFHPLLWESLVAYTGEDVPFRLLLSRQIA